MPAVWRENTRQRARLARLVYVRDGNQDWNGDLRTGNSTGDLSGGGVTQGDTLKLVSLCARYAAPGHCSPSVAS
jgi:hypothetical protein